MRLILNDNDMISDKLSSLKQRNLSGYLVVVYDHLTLTFSFGCKMTHGRQKV